MAEEKLKICFICKEELPIGNFYIQSKSSDNHSGYCRECTRKKYKGAYWENIWETDHRVPMQPGVYMNDWQRENTANILKLLGWKFNPLNEIWWKLPMKNKQGEWIFPKNVIIKELMEKPKRKYRLHTRDVIIKRKLTLINPPENYKPKRKNISSLSNSTMQQIRNEYQLYKITQPGLAKKYKVSQSYINQIIHYKV